MAAFTIFLTDIPKSNIRLKGYLKDLSVYSELTIAYGESKVAFTRKSGERGQTLILVAVALVSLLAMAALAIDVVTLYVARSEMQRAADAAALAAAKAFVDSGTTSDPTNTTRQGLAQTMATAVIQSILPQNRVSGAPPTLAPGSPTFDFTRPDNPQVTVTLQRTDLPTFFARIWGSRLSTVSATAVAEAYNPSNAPAGYPPIAPKCVKPLLVANRDPASGTQFVDPTLGTLVATNVVGEPIRLRACAAPPLHSGCPRNRFSSGDSQSRHCKFMPRSLYSTRF